MRTALDTTGDDWWRQVMTEKEHDELEAAFADIVAEHEALKDIVKIPVEIVKGEIVDILHQLHVAVADGNMNAPVIDVAIAMLGAALSEYYMASDMDVDERASAAWHWFVEHDPTYEDMDEWGFYDDDDDVEGWEIDDD